MRKIAEITVGLSLALATAGAVADGSYPATESGYVSDDDGRLYTYAIHGTDAPATAVVAGGADVNADARGATSIAQVPAPSVEPQTYHQGTSDNDATTEQSIVSVRAPDVNEVFGRA